jgi:hypothetical protein
MRLCARDLSQCADGKVIRPSWNAKVVQRGPLAGGKAIYFAAALPRITDKLTDGLAAQRVSQIKRPRKHAAYMVAPTGIESAESTAADCDLSETTP